MYLRCNINIWIKCTFAFGTHSQKTLGFVMAPEERPNTIRISSQIDLFGLHIDQANRKHSVQQRNGLFKSELLVEMYDAFYVAFRFIFEIVLFFHL